MDAGLIGLGTMGTAMANRLLDQGVALTAWNRSSGAADQLVTRGLILESNPAAVFNQPVVLSMLSNDAAVLDTFNDRLLSSLPEGAVHVNMATISIEAARAMYERHAKHNVGYVSAPVLGRPPVAAAGKLLIVASGDSAAIQTALPVLEELSARVFVLGDAAQSASLVKIAVNFNIIHALQALAESIALVERGGVDPVQFVEILTHTAFAGSAYSGYGSMIAESRYSPAGFAMELGIKDLSLTEQAADEFGLSLPSTPVLRSLFETALADDSLRDLDWSAVAEVTRSPKSQS